MIIVRHSRVRAYLLTINGETVGSTPTDSYMIAFIWSEHYNGSVKIIGNIIITNYNMLVNSFFYKKDYFYY